MKGLVLGAARSGIGAAHLLIKHGYDVTMVVDKDFEEREALEHVGVHVVLDDQETDAYDSVDLVVKNPGIPNTHSLVKRFKHVINEIELAQMFNKNMKLYGISGTNGKTTTTTLLYHMLQAKDIHAKLAGNVGISLSEIVTETGDVSFDVALELSSFQMENLDGLNLETYALLNLTPDHLNRYPSVEAYYEVKASFAKHAKRCIRNVDDENVLKYTESIDVEFIDVSLNKKCDVYVEDNICMYRDIPLFNVSYLNLAGKHNLMNAMFAAVTAHFAHVDQTQIERTLSNFKGVEHRLEFVEELNGVRYYNDSKATNPEACEVALQAFNDNQVILLAGGYDKHIPFDRLKAYKQKVKYAFLFGDSASKLHEVFEDAQLVETMQEALQKAYEVAKPNDVVLLSPACASFDQFKDYEERGEIFKECVKALK